MKWIIAEDIDGTGHMLVSAKGWETLHEPIKREMKKVVEFNAPDFEAAKKVCNDRYGYS